MEDHSEVSLTLLPETESQRKFWGLFDKLPGQQRKKEEREQATLLSRLTEKVIKEMVSQGFTREKIEHYANDTQGMQEIQRVALKTDAASYQAELFMFKGSKSALARLIIFATDNQPNGLISINGHLVYPQQFSRDQLTVSYLTGGSLSRNLTTGQSILLMHNLMTAKVDKELTEHMYKEEAERKLHEEQDGAEISLRWNRQVSEPEPKSFGSESP